MSPTGYLQLRSSFPLSFDWHINNYYSKPQKCNRYFNSPLFDFMESNWYLQLYPNGQAHSLSNFTFGYIDLYLKKGESFIKYHNVSYTLGIRERNGRVYKSKECTHCFKSYDSYGNRKMVKASELMRNRAILSPKETLTVFISDFVLHGPTVDAYTQTTYSTGDEYTIQNEKEDIRVSAGNGIDILVKNFKDLFLNEEACDVSFKVKNQELHAHRSILVARSPVFASMFRHNMSEKNTGVVNILDCGPDAFKELLLYFYTGTVEHLSSDIVYDLYEAAVKYDLEDLKNRCVHFMQGDMSADTFYEVITLSLKHNESQLIKYATDFFTEHAMEILPTVKWELYLKENPVQANELYMKAMKSKS